MGFFRRIAGLLGISKDDADQHETAAAGDVAAGDGGGGPHEKAAAAAAGHGPRRGFSVQVPLTVERSNPGPVIVPCALGDGGIQGFRWYTRRLRIDEDGDVADEFLDEVIPETLCNNDSTTVPKFQVKYNTRPTALAMRKQTIAIDGDIRHSLEYQGQLRWV